MRIRHYDPKNAEEKKAHAKLEKAIDAWWKAFAKKVDAIGALFVNEGERWDLPEFMHHTLGAVDKRLMWEFGRPLGKSPLFRLVITPEHERELMPLSQLLFSRAPKMPKVELYDGRVPERIAMVDGTVKARLGDGMPETQVVVTPGEHLMIDLSFLMKGCKGPDDEDARAKAIVAAEVLLGEKMMVDHIGAITVGKPKKSTKAIELRALRTTVQALAKKIDGALPSASCMARKAKAQWTLFKLEQAKTKAKDFPGQQDLFVAVTMIPDVWQATHATTPFRSRRFSSKHEVFVYIKIDGAKGLEGTAYEDREDIENDLAKALEPKLGCVVGGGTGTRYSYVELALLNVPQAIPAIQKALIEGKITERAWILFHDSDLAAEWIGIYPKTPAPPT